MVTDSSAQAAHYAGSAERPPIWSGHISAGARDVAESARFYEAIGLRPVFVSEEMAVLELRGGTHILLRPNAELDVGPAPFDLMVEDLVATHAEWTAAGMPVSGIAKGRVHDTFTVTDPAGNVIRVSDSHVVGIV